MSHRPPLLIGWLGTNTEVGKTWTAVAFLKFARGRGMQVAARKPVQSFEAGQIDTDAVLLANATGESEFDVCPEHRRYPLALAPPMAADLLQRPRVLMRDLITEIQWQADVQIGIVETVGGPRSPLAHDGDSVDLLRQIRPDEIVLVADAGLGTINAIRLSLQSIAPNRGIVLLNRFEEGNELHRLNRAWLIENDGVHVVTSVDDLLESLCGEQ